MDDRLSVLAGASLMAHAVLLRCYVLARSGRVDGGLLTNLREWSMTRPDVVRGLAELEARGLVIVQWVEDSRSSPRPRSRMVVVMSPLADGLIGR